MPSPSSAPAANPERIRRWDDSPSSSAPTLSARVASRSRRRRPSTARRSCSATAVGATPTSARTRSTTPPTSRRWPSGLRPGARDRVGRQPARRLAGRHVRLPRRLHRPPPRRTRSHDDARGHARPRLRPRAGAPSVLEAWAPTRRAGRSTAASTRRRSGPRFETPAEVRLIAAHRRPGRDDDRRRVHPRQRARDRLRRGLRRRQPRQRPRRRAADGRGVRGRHGGQPRRACSPASTRCCRELAPDGALMRAHRHGRACSTASASGCARVDGTIAALGPDVVAEPGDEILDARRAWRSCPALVNGHTHAAMTLFRGYGDDLPLMEWLEERIWPAEARLTADDVYWGTRLACLEMIRSGTVRFWDMYWQPARPPGRSSTAGCGRRSARRCSSSPRRRPRRAGRGRASALAELERGRRPRSTRRARSARDLHRQRGVAAAASPSIAAERDVPVHIHLSETEQEVDDCIAAHGCRPAALPRPARAAQRADGARARRLARRRRARADRRRAARRSSPTRSSNMKLAVGAAFAYPRRARPAIPVGLGTDGAGSNNSLDLLADVKVLRARCRSTPPPTPPRSRPTDAWAIATGALAPLLGGTPARGRRAGRLPARRHRRARARARRPRRRPRLRRRRHRRRHRRRRRPRADARRRRAEPTRSSPRPASARSGSVSRSGPARAGRRPGQST